MTKSTAMILRSIVFSAFLLGIFNEVDAQFISMNEPKRKELKSAENVFKVIFSEEDKNLLNFKIKVNNPTQESVRAYLRNRNGANMLDERTLYNSAKIVINLDLAPLEDGEYTFVVRSENGFLLSISIFNQEI
jgi:6-pyruvoyl-tetrahydropterin synthase